MTELLLQIFPLFAGFGRTEVKLHFDLIAQRYEELVSALYGKEPSVVVETEITYQDGRTSTQRTEIRVESLGDADLVEGSETGSC